MTNKPDTFAGVDLYDIYPETPPAYAAFLRLVPVARQMAEACRKVDGAFNTGRYDKYGRLRLTRAEGDQLWFAVSQALAALDALEKGDAE